MQSQQKQIEVVIKKALLTPSANLFLGSNSNQSKYEMILLGELGTTGVYRFNLGPPRK